MPGDSVITKTRNRKDYLGLETEHYKVLSKTDKRTKGKHTIWLVQCKCGKIHERSSDHLTRNRRGPIKACDCYHPWNYSGLTRKGLDLRKRYGMTEKQLCQMLKDQDGKCLICGSKEDEKLHVDHCHSTGKVRGLLCKCCNVTLGMLNEDKALFERCIEYLEEHKE